MNEPSDENPDWEAQRDRIIGLGKTSIRKSYYPELQQRIFELEKKNRELEAAYAEQTAVQEELRQQIEETGKTERALRINEERLVMAQEIGHSGSWDYSFETDQIWGSAEALRIYGFPPTSGYYPIEEIEARVEDRERVQQAFVDFIEGRREYDIEITVNPLDGSSQRVVRSIARLERDVQGRPVRVVGVLQDITERKMAENALRKSEERFRNLIEASPVPIVLVRDGVFLYTNSAFCTMTGYDRPVDLTGKPLLDFVAPESRAIVAQYVAARSRGEPAPLHYESVGLRRDGSRFPYEITVGVINLSQGPATMAFITDISGRKQAEERIRASEEMFRSLVRESADGLSLMDEEGIVIEWNDAMVKISGIPRQEAVGAEQVDLMVSMMVPENRTPERIEIFRRAIREAQQTGKSVHFSRPIEAGIIRRDGSRRQIHQIAFPIRTAKGYRIGSIARDITESKSAQDALKVSEERYRSLVNITDTGYLVLDKRGYVIDANEVYLRLTGRSSLADLIGHSVTEWTATYDLERNAREVENCIKSGQVRGLEIDYVKPDKTIQPMEINATVFHSGEGDVILTLCRDISSRKKTDVALQQARNKLNLLNAVTFQDIQTAAFSLSAYQELIKNALTDPKSRSYVAKQEIFLKKMVDTLDFARNYQEMGIHPPRWQKVNQVFLYAISHLDFLHMNQNLHLEDLEIFADPLFEKALFNIMENVLVHGVSATEVTLRYEEKSDHLTLFIEDNGVGILSEEKNMIFDRGYGKGSGLGLFLVREVLSITGMSIRETGSSGQGTRFEITVPRGMYRITR